MKAAALAAALAAAAPPPQQFDLVCRGHEGDLTRGSRQFERRFSVDLAAGRWCFTAQCETRPIEDVGPDVIVLQRRAAAAGAAHIRHEVNRATGAYVFEYGEMGTRDPDWSRASGVCEPAPFTAFPKARF